MLNDSATYLYLKNAQGDITGIVDENGEIVVRYTYNAWGAVDFVVPFGVDPSTSTILATVSPFTYRGYCYDYDIGMYYLQSRYYDPEICRFINADSTDYLGATGTLLSYNLFAYCENDGVNAVDYKGFFSNKVALYWVAGYDRVIIYIRNIGVDTLDYVRGTVKSDNGKKEGFSRFSLKPFTTYTITVKLNMLKCKEKLTVSFYGQDGNNISNKSTVTGTREIQSELVQYWNKGNSPTVYESINHHFKKHGKEVYSTNIGDYVEKSIKYRNEVVNDIKKLSKTKLKKKYKITNGTGRIPSKKYKNKSDGRYILLTNNGKKILSFGR